MNGGWLPKFCIVFRMIIVWVRSSESWMSFCTKQQSRHHGVQHWSKCFPKLTVLASQLIFGPLQTYASCTEVCAYLVLGRIEATLEQHQPEEWASERGREGGREGVRGWVGGWVSEWVSEGVREGVSEWVSGWVKPVCPKAAHERHRWKRGACTQKKYMPLKCRPSGPTAKKKKIRHQCLPISTISCGQLPFPQTLIPAERSQHVVPLLAWATDTTLSNRFPME